MYSDESASELMAALPPVGWGDVATRQDLVLLRHEMDTLRAELAKGYASLQRWTVTTMIALTGIVLAISLAVARVGT